MPKGEEYTLEDLDRDVLEALKPQPDENKGGTKRPNVMEMLKAQGKLAGSKIKR